jgi:hypothetical protein
LFLLFPVPLCCRCACSVVTCALLWLKDFFFVVFAFSVPYYTHCILTLTYRHLFLRFRFFRFFRFCFSKLIVGDSFQLRCPIPAQRENINEPGNRSSKCDFARILEKSPCISKKLYLGEIQITMRFVEDSGKIAFLTLVPGSLIFLVFWGIWPLNWKRAYTVSIEKWEKNEERLKKRSLTPTSGHLSSFRLLRPLEHFFTTLFFFWGGGVHTGITSPSGYCVPGGASLPLWSFGSVHNILLLYLSRFPCRAGVF